MTTSPHALLIGTEQLVGGGSKASVRLKGTDPFFLTNSGHNYHFLFLVKKYPQVSRKRVPKY